MPAFLLSLLVKAKPVWGWLVRNPLLALSAVSVGLLLVQTWRVESLEDDLAAKSAECNARISDGVAAAEKVAREAQNDAIRAERDRWQARLDKSEESARKAQNQREIEQETHDQQQRDVQAIYRREQSATDWRDSDLPESICLRLNQGRVPRETCSR